MGITHIPVDLNTIDYDLAMLEGCVITKTRRDTEESISPNEVNDLNAEVVVEPFATDPMTQWEPPLIIDGNPVLAGNDMLIDEYLIPACLLSATESRTDQALRLRTQSFIKPGEEITPAKGVVLHIGIDSEYTYNAKTGRNDILSYQFFAKTSNGEYADIIYPKSSRVTDRLGFEEFISHIVVMSKEKKIIDEWPKQIYVYAHFLRADLASFGDFWKFKTRINGIRTTVASVNSTYGVDLASILQRKAKPSPLILRDKQRKAKRVLVTFVDTMLHTPGQAGLATVGELIGIPKLTIPDGYSIERMDELLVGDKAAFEAYALRDAEIAVKYGLRLHEFTKNLGLSSLPKSIGGCATSVFLKHLRDSGYDRNQLFGSYEIEQTTWPKNASRPTTKIVREVTPAAKLFEDFAISCYHGGRNECFWCGPTPLSTFNDYDLSGAYTTGLVDLFALDYERARMTNSPADFVGHVFGLARVKFSFPDGIRYPSLPVRAGEYGLLFPLSGESYCTAPEIEVALNLGCNIEVLQGVIIPWADTQLRLFEPFVALVREMRQSYPKKSFDELLWKEIGNSLYGKLAQGLRGKTAFNTTSGLNKPIERSAITNPYFAAHVTGLIRAVLGEQLAAIPAHRKVLSVTTDGYLTDATRDELVSGPISQRFQALGERLDGMSFNMLEQKHQVRQVIAIRTRGQLTAEGIEGEPEILAKCGVKPPCPKEQHQAYMLRLYLERYPGQKVKDTQLISTSDMWINERDLVSLTREKRLNLEFDFKRQPVMPSMQSVLGVEHICFDTQPWPTAQEAIEQRVVYDNWRKDNCLKTLEDWECWEDYLISKSATKGNVMRMTEEGSMGVLKRVFLRAYAQEAFGLVKTMSYAELAMWLTLSGCPTTVDDCKNARRATLHGQCVPITRRTVRLLEVIQREFPAIELEALVVPENLSKIQHLLNESTNNEAAQITLDAPSNEVITD